MPHNIDLFFEATFTFLCDSSFQDRYLIEAWFIFKQDDSSDDTFLRNPQFSYYKDYKREVEVQQLTMNDKPSLVYKLEDAYPISFSAQELSYEQKI